MHSKPWLLAAGTWASPHAPRVAGFQVPGAWAEATQLAARGPAPPLAVWSERRGGILSVCQAVFLIHLPCWLLMQAGNKTEKRGNRCFTEKGQHLPLASGGLRRGVVTKVCGALLPAGEGLQKPAADQAVPPVPASG